MEEDIEFKVATRVEMDNLLNPEKIDYLIISCAFLSRLFDPMRADDISKMLDNWDYNEKNGIEDIKSPQDQRFANRGGILVYDAERINGGGLLHFFADCKDGNDLIDVVSKIESASVICFACDDLVTGLRIGALLEEGKFCEFSELLGIQADRLPNGKSIAIFHYESN